MRQVLQCVMVALAVGSITATPALAAPVPPSILRIAAAFGARDGVSGPSLSPDGKSLVYVAPGDGQLTVANVMDLATGDQRTITYADGKPLRLSSCGWAAADRIVCELYGISRLEGRRLSWTRLVGVDADGQHRLALGREGATPWGAVAHQYDGHVMDWMAGVDGKVLMTRGQGAELVDTRTGKGVTVKPEVSDGWTDGNGNVRIIGTHVSGNLSREATIYRYRLPGEVAWRPFSRVDLDGKGLAPLAVDGVRNVAYATQKKDGRDALYRVALDGTMKTELVYADPAVDVNGVVTIGRRDRVIGLRYETDQPHIVYFDDDYAKLATSLSRVLPHLPRVDFVSASADEKRLLLYAESDVDPGHYYLFDRATHKLIETLRPRPQLDGFHLAERKAISYPAADGTVISAYLTLPPGVAVGTAAARELPALVMPHGGPASRDHYGFDWLSQYFAQAGFAVLQPEYRGSIGYGDAFFAKSGFKSWRIAIADVRDAGHWLVAQGIAAPDRLGLFGWSYGGYAALQVNVIDPTLFKAVVVVAPVTDLARLKAEAENMSNYASVQRFVGTDTLAGSPARHADAFAAPVLIFHGDQDINVAVAESQAMAAALRKAGKRQRLIVYPGLDHQLDDSAARTDLLTQSVVFLRETMGLTH